MERVQQIIGQSEKVESGRKISGIFKEFEARLPKVVWLSAPLLLMVLAACNNSNADTVTPTMVRNFNANNDHVLDINDACQTAEYSLKACFDIEPDEVLNDDDVTRVKRIVGTRPTFYSDVTGDGVSDCKDVNAVEDFAALHKGEPIEPEFNGVSIEDLKRGILLDLITFKVSPNTSQSDIEHILSSSTKYDLLKSDDPNAKTYYVDDIPGKDKSVSIHISDSVLKNPSFSIFGLRLDLLKVEGVIGVNYEFADINLAITQGTPLNCD